MHSVSISLGKDLKGQSTYLRWFLEEHPSERQCLLRMYPSYRRWLVRALLSTRWVSLLETEISMAAALAEMGTRDRSGNLQAITDAYLRRPPAKGVFRWLSRALNANPLLLSR
jgi:hypothetical protein